MTSFPLLRLPRLAFIEVLKAMDVIETLELCQTSMKLSRVVHKISTNKFTFDFIAVSDSQCFLSKNKWMRIRILPVQCYPWNEKVFRSFENRKVLTEKVSADEFHLHFDDPAAGQILIGQYFIKLFKCCFHKVLLGNLPRENLEAIVELLNNREVQRLVIDVERTEDIQFVLDRVNEVGELELRYELHPRSRPLTLRNGPKDIMIHFASWVTLETLKGLNFEKLWLSRSSFTNEDLDSFVTLWKRGNFLNLKHIYVISNRINNQETIGGMFPPILNVMEQHNGVFKYIFGIRVSISGSVEIRRDDGVMAKMFVKTQTECKSFSLFVCD